MAKKISKSNTSVLSTLSSYGPENIFDLLQDDMKSLMKLNQCEKYQNLSVTDRDFQLQQAPTENAGFTISQLQLCQDSVINIFILIIQRAPN